MTNKSQFVTETDIVKLIRDADDNPKCFDALIEDWNSIFSLSKESGKNTFDKVEEAALSSIASMNEAAPKTTLGRRIGDLLEQFDSPAYLVKDNGRIAAQNSAAHQTYNISSEGTLDDLPIDLEQSERITEIICSSLRPGRNAYDAVLKRAHSTIDGSTATLSIAPSISAKGGKSTALVFIINARWKTRATALLKREFDLTTAEQELLEGFLNGQTTQAMAKTRQRSHATVRTQFYSLMGKMGAATQTDLLRNALSVSQFVDQIEEIAEVIRHPHRKRVDIVRPGGRSVEVTMSGDFNGKPIVFFQDAVRYTFEGKIEQAFHDAGYCILSICKPGYGNTDPVPNGADFQNTFASDICSLLDQLGYDRCLLMSMNTSSAAMFAISSRLLSRINGMIQIAAAAPSSYLQKVDAAIPMGQAIINSTNNHPSLKLFLIKSGYHTWKALGQEQFFKLQFRSHPIELEQATRPEFIREANAAFDIATRQGFNSIIADTLNAFSDFREDVLSTKLPILIIHGNNDLVFAIDAVRKFASDFSSRVTFVELHDAGFSAMATHTNEIINHITDFSRATYVK